MKPSIKGLPELGDFTSALAYRDQQIQDLVSILHRWKGSIYTRHLDIAFLDRLIEERNRLETLLIEANYTIEVLNKRRLRLEEFAAGYSPEKYAEFQEKVKTCEHVYRVRDDSRVKKCKKCGHYERAE